MLILQNKNRFHDVSNIIYIQNSKFKVTINEINDIQSKTVWFFHLFGVVIVLF